MQHVPHLSVDTHFLVLMSNYRVHKLQVSGKNSTPCHELKKENTDVILVDMDPEKDFTVVCDCVGILKERHSDIEAKVPATKRVQWKKKQTTKCRMVFRTEVVLENGRTEVLQVASDPISCTQLPGTPEVLKMSLSTCSIEGGEELWMIGKNFLRDTCVIFQVIYSFITVVVLAKKGLYVNWPDR